MEGASKYLQLVRPHPVFSPTQTDLFSTCPVLWWWTYVQGWKPRVWTKKEVAAMVGTVFMDRVSHWLRPSVDACYVPVSLESLINKATARGFDLSILSEYGDLGALLDEAVDKLKSKWEPPWEVIHAIEQPRTSYGWARADVVGQMGQSKVVFDFKFKLTLDTKYVASNMAEYQESTQAHHYVWMEDADAFCPIIVRANPFKVWMEPACFTPARISAWLGSQATKWVLMDRMCRRDLMPWEAHVHSTRFGPCVMKGTCLSEQGATPENLARNEFIYIERTPPNALPVG